MTAHHRFVRSFVYHLKYNPHLANDDMSVVISGLNSTATTVRRLMTSLQGMDENFPLLLEHCLMQHQRLSGAHLNPHIVYNAALTEYVRKMLLLLHRWMELSNENMHKVKTNCLYVQF